MLAGSESTIDKNWTEAPELGIFEVQATATIHGEEFTKTKTVIVFPLWLLIIIVAILLLLITAIVLKIRDHRAAKKQAESN
jgi:signal transduction histidine kinase